MSKIVAIVLAAGTSVRMGGPNKLLADLAGEPVLRRALQGVLASKADPVIVVTGHECEAVNQSIQDLPAGIVHNPDFADGMATSLAAGIAAVPDDADGALVFLGDMPLIGADVIDALIDEFDPLGGRSIAVPVHGNRRGHPVLWGRAYLAELCQLTGDFGARGLLDKYADQVVEVAAPDETIFADADTPDALALLRSKFDC